ncbi:[acyl-carrier-protein] S-malonyltransferase [Litorivivens lipolytica]|uniref:Malonyl CoA-acyl carrier protein transacylase n=1 Tax=Litorivivens lipolytica TaxID=1524264 RepID=A0A7W4W3N3_9GAMM|nr:ACP S-malonyltransferase [Litorivivens lipolytica]MBB3046543.1 [acyl-carrier-protein] S-malonyltransferase [Litorivivens lipolytica]
MTKGLAFVFPGQGSQKVGMLAEIAEQEAVVRETFQEASDALGYDMWDMVQNGEQETLNLTENTQPILLTSSVAMWRVWQARGGAAPSYMAGHSLGEFSALVCAGSLSFADGVKLVRSRGQFMQTAVPVGEGSMAAVLGLDDQVILDICAQCSDAGVVEAVNFNAPGQVVIAGKVAAVDKAIEALKEAGAKRAMPLPVSAPFHTSLMQPAAEKLSEAINAIQWQAPSVPVVHNVHAKPENSEAAIREILIKQLYSPVKWVDCVQTMVDAGVETTLECGPGKVLSGLNKRIHKPLNCLNIEDPASLEKAMEACG